MEVLGLPFYGLFVSGAVEYNFCSDMMDEEIPLLATSRQESHYPQDDIVDPDYRALIQQAEQAIGLEVYPERIKKGSSGSYFVPTKDGVCIKSIFNGLHFGIFLYL